MLIWRSIFMTAPMVIIGINRLINPVEVCLEVIMPSKYYKYSQAKLCGDFNRRRVRRSLEKKIHI